MTLRLLFAITGALAASLCAIAQTSRDEAPIHAQGPLQVRIWADRGTVTPVEDVTLFVEPEIDGGWTIDDPFADLSVGETVGPLTIRAIAPLHVDRLPNGRLRATRSITLSPDLPGSPTLGPYRFGARRAGNEGRITLRTPPVTLEVTSLLAQTGDDFTPGLIRDPLGPAPSPGAPASTRNIVIAALVAALLLAIGGAMGVSRRRARRAASPEFRMRALRAEADALLSTSIDPRAAALAADDATRRALALSLMPDALAMTPAEILDQFRARVGRADHCAALASLLECVERAVFAADPSVTSEDVLRRALNALEFVASAQRLEGAAP